MREPRATLRNPDTEIELSVWYQVADARSDPQFLTARVSLQQGARWLVQDTEVAMIPGDLEAIRSSVLSVVNGARQRDTVASIDDDLLLEVRTSESGVWYHVALWIGEPYVLMRGYRFTADREAIVRFVEDLKSIEDTVL